MSHPSPAGKTGISVEEILEVEPRSSICALGCCFALAEAKTEQKKLIFLMETARANEDSRSRPGTDVMMKHERIF